MSEHSKLPWKVVPCEDVSPPAPHKDIRGPDGLVACVEIKKKDAAYIVLACNAHDALVAACKEIWEYEDDLFDEILEGDLGSIKTSGLCDALKKIKAALKLADAK